MRRLAAKPPVQCNFSSPAGNQARRGGACPSGRVVASLTGNPLLPHLPWGFGIVQSLGQNNWDYSDRCDVMPTILRLPFLGQTMCRSNVPKPAGRPALRHRPAMVWRVEALLWPQERASPLWLMQLKVMPVRKLARCSCSTPADNRAQRGGVCRSERDGAVRRDTPSSIHPRCCHL